MLGAIRLVVIQKFVCKLGTARWKSDIGLEMIQCVLDRNMNHSSTDNSNYRGRSNHQPDPTHSGRDTYNASSCTQHLHRPSR